MKLLYKPCTSLLGNSAWVTETHALIKRYGGVDSPVLVNGPTGTGKELIARAIHESSLRAPGRFIPVCCTTITGSLFASQLFGHRKGAFTGADCDTLGCFRAAHGGTIFLDEIGELEPDMQSKLLRVLQEKVIVPVGANDGEAVDFRLICATNRELKEEVTNGRFREDLFFRLNVLQIRTIPLRQRPADIAILAEHFLNQLVVRAGFPRLFLSPGALELLTHHSWPGNVRELRHVLERAVVNSDGDLLTLPLVQKTLAEFQFPERVPVEILNNHRSNHPTTSESTKTLGPQSDSLPTCEKANNENASDWKTLTELEREHIISTLEHTFYNQSATARLLDISRQSLIRKLKSHGITMPQTRGTLRSSAPSAPR